MGLLLQPSRRISGKIVTLIAAFALIAQPMHGLVTNHVANALGETIGITNAAELRNAIEAQDDGQTWNIQPGNYAVTQTNAITANSQTGYYFPIVKDNITINGIGNPTIYGDGFTANGSHATQNLIVIFGDNVTINGLTLMPKVQPNKTIEIMGDNSTISNVVIKPNTLTDPTNYDGAMSGGMSKAYAQQWGGSILYNGTTSAHTISNVTIYNGGISGSYAPGVTLNLHNVHMEYSSNVDYINDFGLWSGSNWTINGRPSITYHVNDTLNNLDSVIYGINTILPNSDVTISLDSNITTANQTTIVRPITISGNGHTMFNSRDNSVKDNSNNSILGVQSDNTTINNLIIDGTGGKWMHGINAYEATGLNLNNVTLQNNSNAGLIVGKDSSVVVNNITTKNNGWYGINVDKKAGTSATLTVNGTSTHEEGLKSHIFIDNRDHTNNLVYDTNAQYARYWKGAGYSYLLDTSAPTVEVNVDAFNPASFTTTATDDQRLVRIDYSIWKDNNSAQIGVWGQNIGFENQYSFEKTQDTYCDRTSGSCEFKPFTGLPEGEYTLRATVGDVMGKSTNAINATFVVDYTSPSVPSALFTATPSDKSVANNGYTQEQNFKFDLSSDSDTTRYKLRYSNDIESATIRSWNPTNLNSYQGGQGVNVYVDNFTQGEGRHYFSFSACDGAGNCSNFSDPFIVTYDKTTPTVHINSATQIDSDNIEFDGYIFDTNFEHYYCWLTGLDGREVTNTRNENCVTTWAKGLQRNGNPATTEATGSGSIASPVLLGGFDISEVEGGEYTINIIGVDRAKNRSIATTYPITIDRTAPEVTVDPIETSTATTGAGAPTINNTFQNPPLQSAISTFFTPVISLPATDESAGTVESATDIRSNEALNVANSAEVNGEVLAAADTNKSWSAVNLFLAIGVVLASIIALLGIGRKENRRVALRVLSVVPAIGAVALLLSVENFSEPIAIVNSWSWLMAGIALAQIVIVTMTRKSPSNIE